jgi:NADH-quinone oxidoreductase subunit N
MFCGFMSIVVGSVLALYEIKLKKLLAYSSIVHMGYIIISLSIGSKLGVIVSFYYFFIYVLVTLYFFSIFLAIRLSNNQTLKNITDFVYLRSNNKLLSLFTIVSLLSLAGIPPLAGFYGKLYVFSLLINSGYYYLCASLVLLSILSGIYYIRLIRFIFFDDKLHEPMVFIKPQSVYINMSIVFGFFINTGLLFFQEPMLIHIVSLFI